jgi:hypothetical protein
MKLHPNEIDFRTPTGKLLLADEMLFVSWAGKPYVEALKEQLRRQGVELPS